MKDCVLWRSWYSVMLLLLVLLVHLVGVFGMGTVETSDMKMVEDEV